MPSTNSIAKLVLEEAAEKLYQMGIRSATDFQKLCQGQFDGFERRPADIPSNPIMYFKEVNSFNDLIALGQKRSMETGKMDLSDSKNNNEDVMSYHELKQLVRKYKVSSIREWKRALKEERLPGIFPSAPHSYYSNFEGWEAFLAPKRSRFLDWNEAKKRAKALREEYSLKTAYDWRWLSREGKRPSELPSAPDYYYTEFTSWKDFYGLEE
ncbi:hypothetical protein [Pseudoalteromonas sp. SK20]|uniref:hypothetical protein n=1 Tax=Pseudoalteromonas sp. SK20 TaxID=1938367 RepID=UPI0009771467|nr:hypothetical protein [Pseudoalteromonas sp. SK20]